MMYDYYSKNYNRDWIYSSRLRLIEKHNFNIHSSPAMYHYYMAAYLGIILI